LLAKQRASKAVQVYDAFPEEELTHTAYIRKCKYAERASQICTSAMTERAFWGKEKLHVRPHSPRVSRRCKESCLGVLVRVESEIFAAFAKLLDRWTPEQLFRAMLRRKKSTLSEEVFVESLRSLEVAPRHISKKMLSRIFYKLTGVGPDQCRIEEMTYDTFLKKMLTVSKNKQPAPAVPHAAPASQPYSSKRSTLGLADLKTSERITTGSAASAPMPLRHITVRLPEVPDDLDDSENYRDGIDIPHRTAVANVAAEEKLRDDVIASVKGRTKLDLAGCCQ